MTNLEKVDNIELVVAFTRLLGGGIAASLALGQVRGDARLLDSPQPAAIAYYMDRIIRLISAYHLLRAIAVCAHSIDYFDHFRFCVFKN